jgi:hypothetical protein
MPKKNIKCGREFKTQVQTKPLKTEKPINLEVDCECRLEEK